MREEGEDGLLTLVRFDFQARRARVRSSEGHKSLFVRFVIPESANAKRHVPDDGRRGIVSTRHRRRRGMRRMELRRRRGSGRCSAATNRI